MTDTRAPEGPTVPFRAQQALTGPHRTHKALQDPTEANRAPCGLTWPGIAQKGPTGDPQGPPGHDDGYDDDTDCAYYEDYMSNYD